MARTAADAALLLSAMVGADARDPISYPVDAAPFHPLPAVDAKRLRIGTSPDFGVCIVGAEIRRVFTERMRALAPLVALCEPFDFDGAQADAAFDVLRGENFIGAYLEQWRADPQSLGPNVRANMELALGFSLADRAWAHAEQTRLARRMQKLFDRFDLLLAPISPLTPFAWTELFAAEVDGQSMRNYYHWLALTYVVTMAGNPALALPMGVDEHGMPFGVQVIGRHRGDAALLAAGHAIEQACAGVPALCRPRPNLAAMQPSRPALKSIVTHPPQFPR
jgi:Asp-tRNA(Asn)/Glu-tRNA(Gln) amidotransferase A subunit family amidase